MQQARASGEALDQLREGLGEFVYRWLQSCSALPALRLPITLHLGAALAKADGRAPPTETEAMVLFGLPWFRQGWIPADLRRALVVGQSPEDQKTARSAMESLSFTAIDSAEVDALGGVVVAKARAAPADWGSTWASWRRGLPAHLTERDLMLVRSIAAEPWSEMQYRLLIASCGIAGIILGTIALVVMRH